MAINNSDLIALNKLADSHNKLTLIGNPKVVSQAMSFHTYLGSSRKDDNFSIQKHDEMLTDLIKAMRLDLYKKRNTNKGYSIIHLSGKGN